MDRFLPAALEQAPDPRPVARALRRLDGRATIGDVMSATGLGRDVVESALRELLETHRGHVEVGEHGDVVYTFDPRLVRRDHVPLATRIKESLWRGFKAGFKVWITAMLVVYFVVFVALIIAALVAASRGGDRNGGGVLGGGRRRGHGPHLHFPLWWFFWGPQWRIGRPYYGRRFEKSHEEKVPFIKKVFAFVFGPDEPRGTLEQRDRSVLRLIRARQGVLTATELVQHTGLPLPEAEDEMGRLMATYGGDVEVSNEGEVAYTFPELLLSAHRRSRAVSEPDPAWRRLEKARELTGNGRGTDLAIGGLNAFNLVAALTAPLFIFPQLGLGGTAAWVGLVWVPAVFSALFFAVPLARWLGLARENAARRLKNIRKVVLGLVFRQSLEDGPPVTAGTAANDVRIALVDPNAGSHEVEATLEEVAAEFDADVDADPEGLLRFRFPRIRRAFLGAEKVRDRLRLADRSVGEVVYSTADTPEEESARELRSFDRELGRYLSAPDRVQFLEDYELQGIE